MFDFLKNKTDNASNETKELITESFNNSYDWTESERKSDEAFQAALNNVHLRYKTGKIPKLNKAEREILEFCYSRDMKEFLREEFEKHPIVLNEDGGLVGNNPFEQERRLNTEKNSQQQTETSQTINNSDYEIL